MNRHLSKRHRVGIASAVFICNLQPNVFTVRKKRSKSSESVYLRVACGKWKKHARISRHTPRDSSTGIWHVRGERDAKLMVRLLIVAIAFGQWENRNE